MMSTKISNLILGYLLVLSAWLGGTALIGLITYYWASTHPNLITHTSKFTGQDLADFQYVMVGGFTASIALMSLLTIGLFTWMMYSKFGQEPFLLQSDPGKFWRGFSWAAASILLGYVMVGITFSSEIGRVLLFSISICTLPAQYFVFFIAMRLVRMKSPLVQATIQDWDRRHPA